MTVSLELFAQKNALALTRFAFLITGDRGYGEDLVQDVLLSMYRRFGVELAVDDPVAYARRALINANVSRLRRRRVVEVSADRLPDLVSRDDDGPPGSPDDRVWDVLAQLPPRQRTVLVLRYYLGSGDREIAQLLGCRESSVRSLATRAFAALRPVLEPPNAATEVAR